MQWPSTRVSQGGMFHPAKVKYSQETSDLIKLLMEEAKMSMLVRKKVNYHLRNGEPLPLPETKPPRDDNPIESAQDILRRMRRIRKKPLKSIIDSGAYEPTRYRPKPDLREPSEKAKHRLAEFMSGTKLSTTFLKGKIRPKDKPQMKIDLDERIDEILSEINERIEWLTEMEELGQGKKYKDMIQGQIAEKLNEIKKLQKKIAANRNNCAENDDCNNRDATKQS